MNLDRSPRVSVVHPLALLGLAALLGCGGSVAPDPGSPGTDGTPVLTAIYPATTYAGASDQTLTLVGSGFVTGATVEVNGVGRVASFVSASHLAAPITASEQAVAGTFAVRVVNPAPTAGISASRDLSVVALTLGETAIATPDWTAETHGKLKAAAITSNLGKVFDESRVQRLDVIIDSRNWAVMQDNLAGLRSVLGNSRDFSVLDDPLYVPCEVRYDGKEWYRVGIRFKGNSSLYSAGGGKLPLKLKFNEFEGIYPAIAGQRFHGFKSLSLKSNFKDESEIHEQVAGKLFRDFGLKGPHASYYELHVDTGTGPVYFGLYTLVEEVDDTVVKTQYADDTGNLYKPEEGPATFAAGSFGTWRMGKKTNEEALDYSDVLALHDALNSGLRVSAPATWKANLERILDVPVFLRWLAANSVMQNWDTYGAMPHNFYLYRNPASQLLEWIPWDSNEALVPNDRCLSLAASEVTSSWPLIRFLLDDADYAARYREYVHEFAGTLFSAARMVPLYEAQSALIGDAVLREGPGYTFTSSSRFSAAISALKAQVAAREAAALAY
jgi:spore coat protein CotH